MPKSRATRGACIAVVAANKEDKLCNAQSLHRNRYRSWAGRGTAGRHAKIISRARACDRETSFSPLATLYSPFLSSIRLFHLSHHRISFSVPLSRFPFGRRCIDNHSAGHPISMLDTRVAHSLRPASPALPEKKNVRWNSSETSRSRRSRR